MQHFRPDARALASRVLLATALTLTATALAAASSVRVPSHADRPVLVASHQAGPEDVDRNERIRTPDQMDAHLNRMDALRDRVRHVEADSRQREGLLRQYRRHIHQTLQGMDRMPRPEPDASGEEVLRYMEQRQRQMEWLLRHMWQYQQAQDTGG